MAARRESAAPALARVDVFVDREVPLLRVLQVLGAAAGAGVGSFGFAVHTPAGVSIFPAQLVTLCACRATASSTRCSQPRVQLEPEGAYVSLDPGLTGDCRVVKRSAMDPTSPEPAPWARAVLVGKGGLCPTLPGADLQARLPAVLHQAVSVAPGCPYGTLEISPEVDVSAMVHALGAMSLIGLNVALDVRASGGDAPSCASTLRISETRAGEAPAPADARFGRPRPGCIEEDR